MGLKTGSKIMYQPSADRAVGTIQGIMTAARIGLLKRMRFVRINASPSPNTALKGTVTMA